MYKNQITKWKLDKKTKEEEAWAVLRVQMRRELCGKDSAFRVRGKPLTIDDVLRYFKKKGVLHPDPSIRQSGAPTPPAVEYWTPKPDSVPFDSEEVTQILNHNGPGSGDMSIASQVHTLPTDDSNSKYLSLDQTQHLLLGAFGTQSYEIPESPLPPRNFLDMEKLLAGITNYYDIYFHNGSFKKSSDGYLYVSGTDQHYNSYDNFSDLCYTGASMMRSGKFNEGRRCFSKASDLIISVLESQHPNSLPRIISMFVRLMEFRYTEIVTILASLMRDLARRVLAPGHPWMQIFHIISDLDASNSKFTLMEAWRCICDAFMGFLGQFHSNSLHIKREFLVRSSADPSQSILYLLEFAQQQLHPDDRRLVELRYTLGAALYGQTRYIEALKELEALNGVVEDLEGHDEIGISTMSLISFCEYSLDQKARAESAIRKGIAILEDRHQYSTVNLYYKTVLARWLREWGRKGEAVVLEAEVHELIGPDDIDLE